MQLDGIIIYIINGCAVGPDTLTCTCKIAETSNCPESRESESSIEQASVTSGSSMDSSSSKLLLEVLKAPTLWEIARKRALCRLNLKMWGLINEHKLRIIGEIEEHNWQKFGAVLCRMKQIKPHIVDQ